MLTLLTLVVLLLTAFDHWTTWLCLRAPVPGFDVTESNPIAARLFDWLGVSTGLAIDAAATLGALVFLAATPRLPRVAKLALLSAIGVWTAAAVANNLAAMATLGLPPLGTR
jgi:hypothetical protein